MISALGDEGCLTGQPYRRVLQACLERLHGVCRRSWKAVERALLGDGPGACCSFSASRDEGMKPGGGPGCGRRGDAMNKLAIIKEFWNFLRVRKKWWLAPIVLFLLVLGGLLVFAKGSALAPFIYSLF